MLIGELIVEKSGEDIVLVCKERKPDVLAAVCFPFALLPVYLMYSYFIDEAVWNPYFCLFPFLCLLLLINPYPAIVLRGDNKRIKIFRNFKMKSKSFFKDLKTNRNPSDFSTKNISKIVVWEIPKLEIPIGESIDPSLYSFKIVLHDGAELISIPHKNLKTHHISFSFDQESDANKMVQIMAGYADVPAYDSIGSVLPAISPDTVT